MVEMMGVKEQGENLPPFSFGSCKEPLVGVERTTLYVLKM
jgi:hypothetical protein